VLQPWAVFVSGPGRVQSLLAALAFICCSLWAKNTARYFKEDGGTGAMHIALAPDGTYVVTAREHMFVRVDESGRWSKTDSRIVFTPKNWQPMSWVARHLNSGPTGRAWSGSQEDREVTARGGRILPSRAG
jgi:hypothetical protein